MALSNIATGFFRIEHSTIGKSTHAPGTAAANARYITRRSACEHVETVGFSRNVHAIRREVEQIEASITRKNARIVDKLQLGFDIRVSHEHRHKAVRSFLWQLTDGGRARAFACFHETAGSNPHIHIQFYDKDNDGKPVARLSASPRDRAKAGLEPNATEYVRKLWERSLNRILEDEGYDFRVDRRNNLERGLDKARERWEFDEQHQTYEAPESPEVQVEPANEQPPPDDMRKIVTEHQRQPYEKVLDALDHHNNLQALEAVEHRIDYLEKEAERLTAESARLKEEARSTEHEARSAEYASAAAAETLKDYTRHDGSLKGFHVKLWRFKWRSPARREGERLTGEKEFQDHIHSSRTRQAKELRYSAGVAEKQATNAKLEHERTRFELEETISSFGDKATLDTAREILTNSMYSDLSEVTPDEVYADFENGFLEAHEAKQAFELMGQQAYISRVEAREREEENQLEI